MPRDVKDVQKFLGLAQILFVVFLFCAPLRGYFIPSHESFEGMGTNGAGGNTSTRRSTPKDALCCDPVLKPFDPRLPTFPETDASHSNDGLGAVLCQVHPDGPHPVAYMSKKLSRAERAYEIHDLECLAIVIALKKWRHYVMGKHLPVYTDHAGLQHLLRQPHLNLRQVRWLSMLADYDVSVLYKPGREREGYFLMGL